MRSFRPHHFLCAFCFQGAGYSKKFIRNFNAIMASLNSPDGDHEPITIAANTDDICGPCPHKRDLACESEAKVRHLDAAHGELFGLTADTTITWSNYKQVMSDKLTIEKFNKICQGCEWKASGICESVLRSSGIK